MLRVIFDANIYGKLIEEEKVGEITTKIKRDDNFKVYGFKPIRRELRDTPKTSRLGELSKRNLLLSLYDDLTEQAVSQLLIL